MSGPRRIAAVGRNFAVNCYSGSDGYVSVEVTPHHKNESILVDLTRVKALNLALALLVAARITVDVKPFEGADLT